MLTQLSSRTTWGLAIAGLATVLNAAPALAYVGPGAGLTALGTMIAVIAVLLLAVVGFVWYPLKRLLRKNQPVDDNKDPR
ncbi:hypothetical protein [Paracoccus saliphilus]|uniref:Uncharacterized protein n=1 Tax=Paracoccus saliphilus TaxID=405559 RepID=A0AA45W5Y7_9RHOB|nr:hypothetical protein [Paracoccus saliphilus]SIS96922.1 hypothetical protein SAMN05421772_110124 [Paracoccus saliphilus]